MILKQILKFNKKVFTEIKRTGGGGGDFSKRIKNFVKVI